MWKDLNIIVQIVSNLFLLTLHQFQSLDVQIW